jgi:hypothetical protein
LNKKNGFQQRGLINHVLAKRFINPGDHLFLNCKKKLGRRRLINNGMLINPDLTLNWILELEPPLIVFLIPSTRAVAISAKMCCALA